MLRTVLRESVEDDLLGEAAKIAYYFFLSLFPLLLALFALTGLVGGDEAFARLTGAARTAVPRYAWLFVDGLIAEITGRDRPGLLSFGVLLTLWSASNGIVALTDELNDLYAVAEPRPWWRRRLLALAMLFSGVIMVVLGAAALIPSVAWLRRIGLGAVWTVARWPLGLVFPGVAAWLAFRILPARDQRHATRETLIGAASATGLWILATMLFRLFMSNFGSYDRTYGAVGAVIVLLLWFHMSALAILLGGKLAATLERGRPGTQGTGLGLLPGGQSLALPTVTIHQERHMADPHGTGKRELVEPHEGDKRFVRRNEAGEFTESDDVSRSLSQDQQRDATNESSPGQGDRGDRKG